MSIQIQVRNKVAVNLTPEEFIVCGNSGYVIEFDFDSEWAGETVRTARFVYRKGGQNFYKEVPFTGTTVKAPVLSGINHVLVGAYAGDLRTTTPAVVECEKSILCGSGTHKDPPEDVYNQLVELINSGETGSGGGSGEAGGYYTPNVTQVNDNTVKFSFAASKTGMPTVSDKSVTLPAGKDGEAPTIELERISDSKGSGVEITARNTGDGINEQVAIVYDGKDGYSPVVEVSKTDGVSTVTVTNASGKSSVEVHDGKDATVTAANIEAALGYTPASASDVNKLSDQLADLSVIVTPQMFGAVGDGKTDDTKAFQECFKHTNIHIPAGEYVVKETIEVLPRTNVTGDGQYPSKVLFASDVEGDVLFNVQEYASFSDINIGGSGTTAISTCTAIVFPFKILRLHNVRFRHLNEAVRSDAENVLYNTFVDCTFSNVKYPFAFPNATIFNTSIMQNLEFKNYNTVVTLPGTIYAISFDRCIFEGGDAGNYVLDAAEAASVSFDSCYYENHGELFSSNLRNGNITLRSTWVCVPNTVVLSAGTSCKMNVKFVDSTIENLGSSEGVFDALIDGTNLTVDIVNCMTKSPTVTALVPITTADIATQYYVATGCAVNGGYLTLDTLPVYNGEVE